jgi:2-polyprenyl-6-methoxyphenol hydroxylase-like FAD-dependent oxidoreductase
LAQIPVLIVGAGPVGLALAGDLGWRGTACTLVEKTDGAIYQPKMDMVGVRTMEFCRRWGIVPWVENCPYNRDYPQDFAYVTGLNGYELGREFMPSMRLDRPPPQSPQKKERCPQDMFDPILARFVHSFPHVTTRYRTELISLEQRAGGVTACLRDLDSGRENIVDAAYVVGCDGGTSTVREALGIGMSGSPVLTYTTNAIFRREGFEALHDKKPAYRYIFIGSEGTWATVVAINGRDRWRFSIIGDDSKRSLGEADVRAAIIRAVGCEFDFEILSILPWVRRELIADNYGHGRVYIAGDAAHLTSPTGGFGMNTGIQDSVDIAWKLDGCLRGWGGPELLASYELERRPVAIRNITEATGNLHRMLSPRKQRPPKALFAPGPEGDRARESFGATFAQTMKREWHTLGIHLGYVYEGSPIVVPDGTPAPPDEVMTYTQTARPGSRAPHVWLDEGVTSLDLFGRGFVLLRFGRAAPSGEALVAALRRRGAPVEVTEIRSSAAAELYQQPLVLVRPDGHVAWRGDTDPDHAESLAEIVTGWGTDAARAALGIGGSFSQESQAASAIKGGTR